MELPENPAPAPGDPAAQTRAPRRDNADAPTPSHLSHRAEPLPHCVPRSADREQLAHFLRRGRERLAPGDVGLTGGARRRTPGLRREEVAGLAGVSMDYYTRLEQGRGPRPSRQTLGALARALRLTADARDHLFRLAGEEPPARRASGAGGHVPPGLLLVLDRLVDVAARVLDPLGEVLAQNALSAALFGDLSDRPPADRNLTRRWFTDPAARDRHPAGDHREHSRRHVAQLRAVLSARREDRAAAALVAELRAASAEFAELWDEHEVARRRSDRERVVHPLVGPLELDCQVLLTEEGADDGWGCRLVLLTARPGTPSHQALELLRVVGLQDMTPPRPA